MHDLEQAYSGGDLGRKISFMGVPPTPGTQDLGLGSGSVGAR